MRSVPLFGFRPSVSAFAVMGLASAFALPVPAHAQEGSTEEIVVIARKREETMISVPVSVSAVSGASLAKSGTTKLESLAHSVPNLILGNSNGGFQGGAMAMRGIGASDGNLFGDQAVGFYIDGVMVARATPRLLSTLDLQQVEVLKGPQALYYGKNSPGGVVIMRSADPGDHLEMGASVGYEFYARQVQGEGYVSGPIAPGLGLRIAVGGDTMRGYLHNIGTPGTPYSVPDTTSPSTREYQGRVTVKYDDGGRFRAKFKGSYGHIRDDGPNSTGQLVACPVGGRNQLIGTGINDCIADNRVNYATAGTALGQGVGPEYGDGIPKGRNYQSLLALEMGYDVTDNLTLTSNTGYYNADIWVMNLLTADPSVPTAIIPAVVGLKIHEFSQEMRLTSNYQGPVNFMVGGYFQDSRLSQPISAYRDAVAPKPLFPPFFAAQKGVAYSMFANLSIKPIRTLEISGGARYSVEQKDVLYSRLETSLFNGVLFRGGDNVPTERPSRRFHNVSPDVTITWRPNDRFTVYGGWHRGFLSGGFNPGGGGTAIAPLADRSYAQQVVQGYEVGVKSMWFDGNLRTNLAVYNYRINGLQASRINPATSVQTISNAASARSKGVEFDMTAKTPIHGLTFNGAVGYNKARYLTYTDGPCWGGQRPSEGCNLGFNATTGRFNQQDLSGKPLVRAPDWGASVGIDYEFEDGLGNIVGLTTTGNYMSKVYTDAANTPGSLQPSYWLLDASARYEWTKTGLEFAVLGRNLTNEYYFLRSADSTLTGTPAGSPTSVRSDTIASTVRGREVWVRISYKLK